MRDEPSEAVEQYSDLSDAVANTPTMQARIAKPSNEHLGRPTTYTEAIGNLICERIARGDTLQGILEAEGMPARTTVWQWLATQPAFANDYARARTRQAESIAERGFEEAWADLDPAFVHRARLRFDSAKWMAAKIDPQRWSDKQDVNVNVTDPDASARRAELIAALQRLAVSAPLTLEHQEPETGRD